MQVTINDYSYRSTVASMGGKFMLPVSAQHREGAGVGAGDEVDVDIELDTEPHEITVPQDFADASPKPSSICAQARSSAAIRRYAGPGS